MNDIRKAAEEIVVMMDGEYDDAIVYAEIIAKHCIGKDQVLWWADRIDGYCRAAGGPLGIELLTEEMREACREKENNDESIQK